MRQIDLVDSSILLELLKVPFESDHHAEVLEELETREVEGVELLLPVATVVEVGGHVGRISDGGARRDCADRLADVIARTLRREVPWSFSPLHWDEALLTGLLEPELDWLALAGSLFRQQLEMGDLLIVNQYLRLRQNLDAQAVDLDVWTMDGDLRAAIDHLRGG